MIKYKRYKSFSGKEVFFYIQNVIVFFILLPYLISDCDNSAYGVICYHRRRPNFSGVSYIGTRMISVTNARPREAE